MPEPLRPTIAEELALVDVERDVAQRAAARGTRSRVNGCVARSLSESMRCSGMRNDLSMPRASITTGPSLRRAHRVHRSRRPLSLGFPCVSGRPGRRRPTIGLPPHGESAAQSARAVRAHAGPGRHARGRGLRGGDAAGHGRVAPVDLPAPFPAQNQRAETLSYLLAFGVILPARGRRRRDGCARIAAGPNAPALIVLTGVLAAGRRRGRGQGRRPARGAGRRQRRPCSPPRRLWWLGAGLVLARAPAPGVAGAAGARAPRSGGVGAGRARGAGRAAVLRRTSRRSACRPRARGWPPPPPRSPSARRLAGRLPRRWGVAADLRVARRCCCWPSPTS